MSLLRFLGLDHLARGSGPQDDAASVRRIVEALDRMEPAAARKLARFAYVLGRVARADLQISADETREMERIVAERGCLTEAQAVLVVQIAKSQTLLLGETDGYLVTRAIAADAAPRGQGGAARLLLRRRRVRPERLAGGGCRAPHDRERARARPRRLHQGAAGHREAIASLRR
jgi:hypothetical protein